VKFLLTVRLDSSDERIFPVAAEDGEWALPGSFTLWDVAPEALEGAEHQAFAHGFLGTRSFGWSSLVTVAEMGHRDREIIRERLAEHLMAHYGAPSRAEAMQVAEEEVAFTEGLCEHPPETIIAVDREVSQEGIVESYRVVETPGLPNSADHTGVRLFGPEGS